MENELLTIQDVATKCNVATMTIRRWWYQGRIPEPVKIGGAIRWRQCDIEQWIENRCEPVASSD